MQPINFEGSNVIIGPPKGISEDKVQSIFGLLGEVQGCPVVVTCWRPSAAELEQINKTGQVWLIVYGQTMPPVNISGSILPHFE